MSRTRDRRVQYKKKRKKRTMQKFMLCAACVLICIGVWKAGSFAVHHLFPDRQDQEQKQESDEAQEPSLLDNVEAKETQETVPAFAYAENLLLVNKDYPLADDYEPDLKKLEDYGVYVDESIYDPLMQMLSDGKKEGLLFWVASGYRSTERQRELLDEDIGDLVKKGYSYSEAYEEVVRETMPVGCSEHATGLCADIVAKDYQILDAKQGQTDEIKWLQANCSRYGFILRYPKEKEDITKVDYESWHFRYVGTKAAQEIMDEGITLEEYLGKEPPNVSGDTGSETKKTGNRTDSPNDQTSLPVQESEPVRSVRTY